MRECFSSKHLADTEEAPASTVENLKAVIDRELELFKGHYARVNTLECDIMQW